jgi:hypothetical protein
MGAVANACQPSTLRMLIWPEASNAQNSIATYHQCDRAAEPQRTSSVVLGMGFDNTPEGSLFRSFKQVEGRFHREFILVRR